MASLTWWTWVWVNSGSLWWTDRPGVLRFMGSQRDRHGWATELNWADWNSKEIKPVNPKGNQPWIFTGRTDVEALIFWPCDVKSRLIGKDPDAGKDWEQREKRVTEGKMVGWHHQLKGPVLEQTLADSEGQGSLGCCSLWGHKESDMT